MLRFCNRYHATVSVAIMRHYPNCPDGGDWLKSGWWNIEPGACKVPYGGNLAAVNRYWYFYAVAVDGTVWAGPYSTAVPPTAFSWCINTSSTSAQRVGFRELDIGNHSHHQVNLLV
ncbi:DUF1036 domain-containing protein [Streptomyces sp. ISL-11]|uniref:DUF1036 domain-containing protein n=1 Tax=Streptomyces sp. ISL-11 TaxID=2819174 RepID=UPI001BE7646B|nr:DUF1036 domain-containing protein [Streptomyces sp. ISL-11]MBT2386371.1 DUF1036 domain-containing protein [Streptomyces sp. ISL-11]